VASLKTLCKATAWLDRPVGSVPTKWFAWLRQNALSQVGPQLGDDARTCADVDWCGLRCATAVGVARGIVYKVAITLISPRHTPADLLVAVSACIEQHLGSHPTTAVDGLLIFDAADGNVVVQEVPDGARAHVVVYATSTSAATLAFVAPADQK